MIGQQLENCQRVITTGHAFKRMTERGITQEQTEEVMRVGRIIDFYPDAKPCPCFLLLNFVGLRPIHVVVGRQSGTAECWIITVYEPDLETWETDFATRRKPLL